MAALALVRLIKAAAPPMTATASTHSTIHFLLFFPDSISFSFPVGFFGVWGFISAISFILSCAPVPRSGFSVCGFQSNTPC